jgi:hypothetical protein
MNSPTAEETAPVNPNHKTKDEAPGNSATAETTQLEDLEAMIKEWGLTKTLNKFLPAAELYTLRERTDFPDYHKLYALTQGSLLFLGQNAECETWACMGLPDKKSFRIQGNVPDIPSNSSSLRIR